jgi:hypothetical protein
MADFREWYDLITGHLWLLLALFGIVLRFRRLLRLNRIVLVEPVDPRDEAYLAQVKRSTYLRLAAKAVLLVGALIAVFDASALWWLWRAGVCLMLVFMILETTGVDRIRDVLGRSVPSEVRKEA